MRCSNRLLFLSLAILLFSSWNAFATCTATATGVTICSPVNGATLASPVVFDAAANSGNAADPVHAMKIYIDGVSRASSTSDHISASLPLTDGKHNITIKGWTASGAVVSKSISILVSTSACTASPNTVNICSPANNATAASPVHLIAAINMAAGLSGARVYVDGVSRLQTTNSSIVADISMSAGTRKVTVKGWGKDGVIASKSIYLNVTSGTTSLKTETVASGLFIPWEMVFSSDGRMFFTEQRGRLRVIANGSLVSTPLLDLRSKTRGGEEGMLGLGIDPNFASNHYLYMFWCYITSDTTTSCNIDRVVIDSNTSAHIDKTLLKYNGSHGNHNAGRLKLGRDGYLYLAVGDFFNSANAQSMSTFAGKILRLQLDGSPAPGNPFTSSPYIYALGFRDPQGLAFDSNGQLYGTDHGNIFNDEVNLITSGANYGWPNCEGSCTASPYVPPLRVFTSYTIAPAGATFYYSGVISQWTGSLLFASLGQSDDPQAHHLHRIKFASDGRTIQQEEVIFKDQFGRIRNVAVGPDGYVYFSTSNGNYTDKIVRVKPAP
jgi:glucose/arabinose dehydrogenase